MISISNGDDGVHVRCRHCPPTTSFRRWFQSFLASLSAMVGIGNQYQLPITNFLLVFSELVINTNTNTNFCHDYQLPIPIPISKRIGNIGSDVVGGKRISGHVLYPNACFTAPGMYFWSWSTFERVFCEKNQLWVIQILLWKDIVPTTNKYKFRKIGRVLVINTNWKLVIW